MEILIKGYWENTKDKIKIKFPDITDDDLVFNDGKEQVMLDKLSYKMGKTKEELQMIIAKL